MSIFYFAFFSLTLSLASLSILWSTLSSSSSSDTLQITDFQRQPRTQFIFRFFKRSLAWHGPSLLNNDVRLGFYTLCHLLKHVKWRKLRVCCVLLINCWVMEAFGMQGTNQSKWDGVWDLNIDYDDDDDGFLERWLLRHSLAPARPDGHQYFKHFISFQRLKTFSLNVLKSTTDKSVLRAEEAGPRVMVANEFKQKDRKIFNHLRDFHPWSPCKYFSPPLTSSFSSIFFQLKQLSLSELLMTENKYLNSSEKKIIAPDTRWEFLFHFLFSDEYPWIKSAEKKRSNNLSWGCEIWIKNKFFSLFFFFFHLKARGGKLHKSINVLAQGNGEMWEEHCNHFFSYLEGEGFR